MRIIVIIIIEIKLQQGLFALLMLGILLSKSERMLIAASKHNVNHFDANMSFRVLFCLERSRFLDLSCIRSSFQYFSFVVISLSFGLLLPLAVSLKQNPNHQPHQAPGQRFWQLATHWPSGHQNTSHGWKTLRHPEAYETPETSSSKVAMAKSCLTMVTFHDFPWIFPWLSMTSHGDFSSTLPVAAMAQY